MEHRPERGNPRAGRDKQQIAWRIVAQTKASRRPFEMDLIAGFETKEKCRPWSVVHAVEDRCKDAPLTGWRGNRIGTCYRMRLPFNGNLKRNELPRLEIQCRGRDQSQVKLTDIVCEIMHSDNLGSIRLHP